MHKDEDAEGEREREREREREGGEKVERIWLKMLIIVRQRKIS